MKEPKTAGIAPAKSGALSVLQFAPSTGGSPTFEVAIAAAEVSKYHAPINDQATRHLVLSTALENFLQEIVYNCPPGQERSTAIIRAREAKFWSSAAIALEGK